MAIARRRLLTRRRLAPHPQGRRLAAKPLHADDQEGARMQPRARILVPQNEAAQSRLTSARVGADGLRRRDTSHVDPTTELLDRQVNFLLQQPDEASFLIQVEPFLRALETDDRLRSYLEDVLDELVRDVQVLEAVDAELVPELVELRHELVTLRAAADDSDAERPQPGASRQPLDLLGYRQTLAYFDEQVAAEPELFNYEAEGGKAKMLLGILQAKDQQYLSDEEEQRVRAEQTADEPQEVAANDEMTDDPARVEPNEANQDTAEGGNGVVKSSAATVEPERTELDQWRTRVGNVDRRLSHSRRWFRLRMRTSPGLALRDLQAARDAVQPPLKLVDPDDNPVVVLSDMVRMISSADYPLLKVADGDRLDDTDRKLIAERVTHLRSSAERLHEELRRRIGATRSRLALVHRFKLRCEWHDRERMAAVADDRCLGGGPEDRLTAEFARYLFDQGLSPLSKPMTGGLQPDLLDPAARFYVEAKQYDSSARGDIVKAVAQVIDTVGRLRGGQYEVEEAFCVIFRRKGPYYDLPDTLHTHSYRLQLVLVDLAAADETGRRQREKPVLIDAAEFFAAELHEHSGTVQTEGTPDEDAGDTIINASVDHAVDAGADENIGGPADS